MFVFVRQDISLAQKIVQYNHAVLSIASSSYEITGIPNIVMIGIPDLECLCRAESKLAAHFIPHVSWHEPDGDLGFTSIATIPISSEQKKVLSNYRLWHPVCSRNSEKEWPSSQVDGESVVQFHPGAPTQHARVA